MSRSWSASGSTSRRTREFCGACARATGGNPFLLGELLTDLAGEQVAATAANAAQVEQASPESVRRVVLGRLERLGSESRPLRRRWPFSSTPICARLPSSRGSGSRAAVAAADQLLSAGILTEEPLTFVHPLLRLAVYEQIPPGSPCRRPPPRGAVVGGRRWLGSGGGLAPPSCLAERRPGGRGAVADRGERRVCGR